VSQRLNRDRYAVHGKWREQPSSNSLLYTYHVADLLEKGSGHVWHDGAHRVKITPPGVVKDWPRRIRSTTFYGESAWSDAERLIRDAENQARYR
jgi:hypothetical protein